MSEPSAQPDPRKAKLAAALKRNMLRRKQAAKEGKLVTAMPARPQTTKGPRA